MDRRRYPRDWPAVSRAIRERAGQRCECSGQCGDEHADGRCGDPECRPVRVVLTVAHVDHDPSHADPEGGR